MPLASIVLVSIVLEGIRMMRSSPGSGGGVGNRSPRMNAPRGQCPHDRADERPFAAEKSSRACHIDIQTLRPCRLMVW